MKIKTLDFKSSTTASAGLMFYKIEMLSPTRFALFHATEWRRFDPKWPRITPNPRYSNNDNVINARHDELYYETYEAAAQAAQKHLEAAVVAYYMELEPGDLK